MPLMKRMKAENILYEALGECGLWDRGLAPQSRMQHRILGDSLVDGEQSQLRILGGWGKVQGGGLRITATLTAAPPLGASEEWPLPSAR